MKEPLKYVSGWINTALILVAFGTVFYNWAEIKTLMFDNVRQKIETVDHPSKAEEILEEVQKAAKVKKEDSEHAIKSRAKRDSILEEQVRINRLNAIQIEKTIKQNDSLLKKWKDYEESVN